MFKKFLLRIILNKHQRCIIDRALFYSAMKYQKQGDMESALEVGFVRKEIDLEVRMKTIPMKLHTDIVQAVIDEAVRLSELQKQRSYTEGHKKGWADAMLDEDAEDAADACESDFAPNSTITKKKCAACEEADNCFIRKDLFGPKVEEEHEESEKVAESETKTEDQESK